MYVNGLMCSNWNKCPSCTLHFVAPPSQRTNRGPSPGRLTTEVRQHNEHILSQNGGRWSQALVLFHYLFASLVSLFRRRYAHANSSLNSFCHRGLFPPLLLPFPLFMAPVLLSTSPRNPLKSLLVIPERTCKVGSDSVRVRFSCRFQLSKI